MSESEICFDGTNNEIIQGIARDVSKNVYLRRMTEKIQRTFDEGKIVEQVLDAIIKMGFKRARLYYYNKEKNCSFGVTYAGLPMEKYSKETFHKFVISTEEDKFLNTQFKSGEPILYTNDTGPHRHDLEKEDVIEWLEVPLIVGGKPLGRISIDNKGTDYHFSKEDQDFLANLGRVAAQAIKNARSFADLEELAEQKNAQAIEIANLFSRILD